MKELRRASGAAGTAAGQPHASGAISDGVSGRAASSGALAVRAPAAAAAPAAAPAAFRDGFWVALLNPKTALFFAAFLPQFIDPRASPLTESLGLSAAFILVAICTDTLYVLTAGMFGPQLERFGRRTGVGRYLAGLSFIALGVFVAWAGNRPAAR
jgi:threonine/homoserine/homoserine lactone efflux protein